MKQIGKNLAYILPVLRHKNAIIIRNKSCKYIGPITLNFVNSFPKNNNRKKYNTTNDFRKKCSGNICAL